MKNTKKFILTMIAVMAMVVLAACGGNSSSSSDNDNGNNNGGGSGETVSANIGVVSFMTGSGAAYGEAITNGLKLAQEELNEAGDVNIELLIEDSAGEADQALSAAQKLMNSEDIVG